MTITIIEVEKREKDEKFTLTELKMLHQNCFGGEIKTELFVRNEGKEDESWYWKLRCPKCGWYERIYSHEAVEIINTAVTGRDKYIYAGGRSSAISVKLKSQ